jgi:two-component system, NtrC family, response regulator AtoC
MKITIIDDDSMYQTTLKHQLKAKLGDAIEVETYNSGEKMLLFLNPKSLPELIILDYFLDYNPYSINGYEILKVLKSMVPDSKIVMVTGGDNEDHKEKFIEAGATDFILKDKDTVEKIIDIIKK